MNDTDAYRAAVRLLAASDKTPAQLYARLSEKGFPDGEIKAALSQLTKEGYLNEDALAEKTVDKLYKGFYGRGYILAYMAEKGFSAQALERAEEYMNGLDFDLSAKEYYKKLIQSGKTKAQATSALSRRGFEE